MDAQIQGKVAFNSALDWRCACPGFAEACHGDHAQGGEACGEEAEWLLAIAGLADRFPFCELCAHRAMGSRILDRDRSNESQPIHREIRHSELGTQRFG